MVRFVVIATLVVLALVFGPVFLLSRADRESDRFQGKTVLYNSLPARVKTLDPVLCGDTISHAMQANVYEGLYEYAYLKRPIEVIPCLADSMPEISPDGKTYRIHLRSGVFYAPNPCFGVDANGHAKSREMRASDFVLSFLRVADSNLPSPQAWSFFSGRVVGLDAYHEKTQSYRQGDFSRYDLQVEGIKALDDLTLEIKLTEPFPPLVYVLAIASYCPMPPEVIHYYLERTPAYALTPEGLYRPIPGGGAEIPMVKRTAELTRPEMAVGTGPYVITFFERSGRIIFERNPLFRDERYPSEGAPGDKEAGLLADAGKRIPFIDVLCYDFIQEELPTWLRFLSGQQDISPIPRDAFSQVITPDKDLAEKWKKKGIRLVTYDSPDVFWLGFNMDDKVIKASKSLRQAMCLAYNVEAYVDVLFNGRGKRAVNILPSSFPVYKEAGPGPYAHYDPKAAKAKLADAKKELAAAGLLTPQGQIPEIVIDFGGLDELYRRIGEFTRQQFEAIGLKVKIQLNDWPTLQQKVQNKQTQLYAMGWSADYPDPENFLQLFYGPNIDKGTNSVNYRNPKFDALYRKIVVMPDSPERREICARMVRMLNEDVPVLLMTEPVYFVLTYDYLHNYKRHPFGYGMVKYLRLDEKRREQLRGD